MQGIVLIYNHSFFTRCIMQNIWCWCYNPYLLEMQGCQFATHNKTIVQHPHPHPQLAQRKKGANTNTIKGGKHHEKYHKQKLKGKQWWYLLWITFKQCHKDHHKLCHKQQHKPYHEQHHTTSNNMKCTMSWVKQHSSNYKKHPSNHEQHMNKHK